jgi:hypothetical protein
MWDWAIWGALIVAVPAGIVALALVFVRAREALRLVRDTRHEVVRGLDDFATQARATADKIAGTGNSAELQESLGRLRVSLARLAVLRAALGEAQVTFGRVTALVPRR